MFSFLSQSCNHTLRQSSSESGIFGSVTIASTIFSDKLILKEIFKVFMSPPTQWPDASCIRAARESVYESVSGRLSVRASQKLLLC